MIWYPFTQHRIADSPIHIAHGKDAYLYDIDGKRYIDLISSWWVNLHGHANPLIADAIYRQALNLEHVIFAGFTHTPAIKLCEKLSKCLPQSLKKFFFSDNGSTAVEVAIKMAYQFFANQNQKERTVFLSFDGAYHGDTVGAMSVAPTSRFHKAFKGLFFETLSIPLPNTWLNDPHIEDKESKSLEILENHLKNYTGRIAAFIAEPLVQGASGMRIYRPQFLQKVVELVRAHGILVIFDEVMTGFYRTGTMFALEQSGVIPDIICLAKGLTGGFLPLTLTVATQEIYDAFLGDTFDKALAHGHSYTANPIACAAAITSLDLLLENKTKKAISSIVSIQANNLESLMRNCSSIQNARQIGTITAFELKDSYDIKSLIKQFLDKGLLIRPLANTIYVLPPYCIKEQDLDYTYDVITDKLVI